MSKWIAVSLENNTTNTAICQTEIQGRSRGAKVYTMYKVYFLKNCKERTMIKNKNNINWIYPIGLLWIENDKLKRK